MDDVNNRPESPERAASNAWDPKEFTPRRSRLKISLFITVSLFTGIAAGFLLHDIVLKFNMGGQLSHAESDLSAFEVQYNNYHQSEENLEEGEAWWGRRYLTSDLIGHKVWAVSDSFYNIWLYAGEARYLFLDNGERLLVIDPSLEPIATHRQLEN